MMKRHVLYWAKRNRKFVLIALAFLVWMIFFDNRNAFTQQKLNKQISTLEEQYSRYELKLDEVRAEYDAMMKHPEKYAREKYYMHKASEEVFLYKK